jgi:molybdopterin-guanine dinucleotide biosynthesis protein A
VPTEPLPPLAIAVVGRGGAGATSLLERTVPILTGQGLIVGYMKAGAHRVDLEGHDTARLRRSVAPQVWDDPVRATVHVVRSLLDAPARQRARDVVGAVLIGGASTRMGADKATLPLRGMTGRERPGTWCERAFLQLAERCPFTWVVGRIVGAGGAELPLLRWPVSSHLDVRPDGGILGGWETALSLAAGAAILALPCDLPELPGEALDVLLTQRDGSVRAVAYRHPDGKPEPALVLLESGVLPALRLHLGPSRRKAVEFLNSISTRWLTVTPELERGFFNLNTPEDRRRYEEG